MFVYIFSHKSLFFSLASPSILTVKKTKHKHCRIWSFSLRRLLLTTVASKLNEKRSLTFEDVSRTEVGTRGNEMKNRKKLEHAGTFVFALAFPVKCFAYFRMNYNRGFYFDDVIVISKTETPDVRVVEGHIETIS